MDELLLEPPEIRGEAYRRQAEAAITSAERARSEEIASYYCRLADIWDKLATTVEPVEAGTHHNR